MFWWGNVLGWVLFFRLCICRIEASCVWEATVPYEEVLQDGSEQWTPIVSPSLMGEVHFGSLAVSNMLLDGFGQPSRSFVRDSCRRSCGTPQCLSKLTTFRLSRCSPASAGMVEYHLEPSINRVCLKACRPGEEFTQEDVSPWQMTCQSPPQVIGSTDGQRASMLGKWAFEAPKRSL